MNKTAIILGATGLTGRILLDALLKDARYGKIKLFSRRTVGINHPKIEEHIVDLFELKSQKHVFTGDEVFCCIGSTKAKTPDTDLYKKIDHGIPVAAAKLCKENNIESFLVISALGADVNSRFFYNKTKGEMESDVLAQNILSTYIFQPSLIDGPRKEKRLFEKLWAKVMRAGNYLLVGPLKKYRSIPAETIVQAMVFVANNGYKKNRIENDEIKEIAKNAGNRT